ncbi:hypothetical protein PoB_005931800 [Plakobranchus ocellatus]|uniref:Uncharacterized protein n=1 Tax=Plakobranchus ocellatus TaxID=259542 RepID=A0AAV4CL53_9GAST|nr:hypothetical protein PoB_005931800 [Plakobranchus ocellatus]
MKKSERAWLSADVDNKYANEGRAVLGASLRVRTDVNLAAKKDCDIANTWVLKKNVFVFVCVRASIGGLLERKGTKGGWRRRKEKREFERGKSKKRAKEIKSSPKSN